MSLRIAMWSGPRNISTAMMRSFGSRSDTHVSDEPLYAAYLRATGKAHPLAEEIQQRHETDWRVVARALVGAIPKGRTVWYQKHMAHHLLPNMSREWLASLTHAFLIRDPRAMLASLTDKLDHVHVEDTGLPQQVELFRRLADQTGEAPPVVDSRDVLRSPESVLSQLCASLGLEFEPAMLAWETGSRETDGCWGPYWYENTYASTRFAPYEPKDVVLDARLEPLAEQCEALYSELYSHRIRIEGHEA